jgi:septum formation protein
MLAEAGVAFEVSPADLNEKALTVGLLAEGADASGIAAALAREKALAVSRRMPDVLVLGGDSVLALGPEIIAKSPDRDALKALLKNLSGRSHHLVSAASLARSGVEIWHHVDRASLTMRVLSEAFIDSYLEEGGEELLSSVGGYHYEGRGAQLFERVEGDCFTIMGLPLLPVLGVLRDQGILMA